MPRPSLDAAKLVAELELRRVEVQRTRPVLLLVVLGGLLLGAGGLAAWIVQQRGELATAQTQIHATSNEADTARAAARDADRAQHKLQDEDRDPAHRASTRFVPRRSTSSKRTTARRQGLASVPHATPAPHTASTPARPPLIITEECAHSAVGCLTR